MCNVQARQQCNVQARQRSAPDTSSASSSTRFMYSSKPCGRQRGRLRHQRAQHAGAAAAQRAGRQRAQLLHRSGRAACGQQALAVAHTCTGNSQQQRPLTMMRPSTRRSLCSYSHIWIFCRLCRNLKIRFCGSRGGQGTGRKARSGGQQAGLHGSAAARVQPSAIPCTALCNLRWAAS